MSDTSLRSSPRSSPRSIARWVGAAAGSAAVHAALVLASSGLVDTVPLRPDPIVEPASRRMPVTVRVPAPAPPNPPVLEAAAPVLPAPPEKSTPPTPHARRRRVRPHRARPTQTPRPADIEAAAEVAEAPNPAPPEVSDHPSASSVEPVAPESEPERPDRAAALHHWRRAIGDAVAAHRRYPRIARRRHWQGTVVVSARIGADGALLGAPQVAGSPGYAALDAEALRMVSAAAPFPPLPIGLSTRKIEIPVNFRLR